METTDNSLSGQCLCGAVRFTVTRTSEVAHCHCRECRRHSGAAFQTWVGVPKTSFVITGPLKSFRSSDRATRFFCASCASLIGMEYDDDTEISVTFGSLDDPSGVTASRHIWTSERLGWVTCVDPELEARPFEH